MLFLYSGSLRLVLNYVENKVPLCIMWLKMLCSKVLVTLGDQNEAVIVTFQEDECVGLATCSSCNSTNSSLVAVDYLLHFLPFTIFVCTKSADLAYT